MKMVQCEQCGASGLKMRDVISKYSGSHSILVCRKCAAALIGGKEPEIFVKLPGKKG